MVQLLMTPVLFAKHVSIIGSFLELQPNQIKSIHVIPFSALSTLLPRLCEKHGPYIIIRLSLLHAMYIRPARTSSLFPLHRVYHPPTHKHSTFLQPNSSCKSHLNPYLTNHLITALKLPRWHVPTTSFL